MKRDKGCIRPPPSLLLFCPYSGEESEDESKNNGGGGGQGHFRSECNLKPSKLIFRSHAKGKM